MADKNTQVSSSDMDQAMKKFQGKKAAAAAAAVVNPAAPDVAPSDGPKVTKMANGRITRVDY